MKLLEEDWVLNSIIRVPHSHTVNGPSRVLGLGFELACGN